jgi:hypothetical protein
MFILFVVIIVVAVIVDMVALLAIKRSTVHTKTQKIWQTILVLVVPCIGAALVLYVYKESSHVKSPPAIANLHDESSWDTLPPRQRSNSDVEHSFEEHD